MLLPESLTHLSTDLQLIEQYAQGDTIFHRWDPRAKIITTFSALILITQIRYFTSGVILFFLIALLLQRSHISLRFLTKRVFRMLMFTVLIIAASLIFTFPGEGFILIQIPNMIAVQLSIRGINQAGLMIMRVYTSILLIGWLLCTTPLSVLFHAMKKLHVPEMFISLTLLTFRYIILLAAETRNLMTAYALRHPKKPGMRERAKAIGIILSQTIYHGYGRGIRVYQAMKVRGFQGQLPCLSQYYLTMRDVSLTTIMFFLLSSWFVLDFFSFGMIAQLGVPLQLSEWISVLPELLPVFVGRVLP